MNKSVGSIITLTALSVSCSISAATINVTPGLNTLRAAIAGAEAGDVLVLNSGSYRISGNEDLIVDKSLTIRAINTAANPIIYHEQSSSYDFVIEGDGTDFILQGVTISRYNNYYNYFKVKGNVSSVALLENYFPNVGFSTEQVRDSDGNIATVDKLLVVGNTINGTSSYFNSWGAEEEFLFAGNVFNYGRLATANYGATLNIIGNKFVTTGQSLYISDSHDTQIIGNTFIQNLSYQTNTSVSRNNYHAVADLRGRGVFLNNVVKQGLNPFNATGTPDDFRTLETYDAEWTIANNVFEQNLSQLNTEGGDYPAFDFHSETTFKNNIVIGNLQPDMFELNGMEAQNFSFIANNLCFNTAEACPTSNGNINDKDPLFVNTTSYALDSESPAIDAGVESDVYKDIDGSRTDLGAQGGIYPLAQFTTQLDVNTTAPYFYPLFEANSSLSNTGELTVKAVAIARQR
jgi:hypothetical protein